MTTATTDIDTETPEEMALKIYPRYDAPVIAAIAAQLAGRAGQPAESYLTAARDAIILLDSVTRAINEREKKVSHLKKVYEKPEAMNFADGVKFITKESVKGRAVEKFQGFLSDGLRSEKAMRGHPVPEKTSPAELSKAMRWHEEKGFPPHILVSFSEEFSAWFAGSDGRKSREAIEKRAAALAAKKKLNSRKVKKVLGEKKNAKK